MRRGLILGKFLPLHNGHLFLFEEARRRCDHLTIALGPRFDEPIPADTRAAWLRASAPDADVVVLSDTLPSMPEHDPAFWPKWRDALQSAASGTTEVYTSEEYGDRLAQELGATHVLVDRERTQKPISGTALRKGLWEHWEYLAPAARAWFLRRVAIVGGESTGKTTMAEQLANRFGTAWVPEFGREYMGTRSIQSFTAADASAIAKGHLAAERAARGSARGVIISDTEAIVTAAWNVHCGLDVAAAVWAAHDEAPYDLYLLLAPDLPWTQDGTRELPASRVWFFEWIRAELIARNLPFVIITGSGEQRVAAAVGAITAARAMWEDKLRAWDKEIPPAAQPSSAAGRDQR